MCELGLDLGFVHAGFHEFAGASETFAGQIARGLDGVNFILGFNDAQFVHERREAMIVVQRKTFPAFFDKPRVARLHRRISALMFVGVEIDIFQLADDLPENHGEIRKPFHVLDAGNFRGRFFRELVAFPDREMFVRLAHEKDFAMVRIERVRREQQNRLLLMHAGEIKQIGILQVAHRTVGIRGHDVVRVQNGERARQQFFDETLAVQREQRGGKGNGFHFKIELWPAV